MGGDSNNRHEKFLATFVGKTFGSNGSSPQNTTPPEERLIISIFLTALKDYVSPEPGLSQEHVRSARAYFERVNQDQFGSFDHFCEVVGMDVEYVERKVREVTEEALIRHGVIVRR